MKPDKNTNYTEFERWSEDLCNKRHDKLVELRKQKATNIFKKWFYLGKKQKDGTYAIENWYVTPYDKLRWVAMKKWHKKVEKHGIDIKRPYFYNSVETYKIWNSHQEYQPHYRKFCDLWWKETINRVLDIPKYHYKTCWYDYYDIFTNLIVNLTIKGLYLGLFGNAVTHKEQMHEIWECRKELIRAYNFVELYEYQLNSKVFKKFGINYETSMYDKEEYLKNEIVKHTDSNCQIGINPSLVRKQFFTTNFTRADVLKKCNEIDEYYNSINDFDKRKKKHDSIMNKAFKLLATNIENMWD